MEYIAKLHKEFLPYKITGVFDSCSGVPECPECGQQLKIPMVKGWGMVSSFHRSSHPAVVYECDKCFTTSYAHMRKDTVYNYIKERFGK